MIQDHKRGTIRSLIEIVKSSRNVIECSGGSGAERAYIVSSLYKDLKVPIVVISSDAKVGESFLQDIKFFSKNFSPPLTFFPSYNITPSKSLAYHSATSAKRVRILYKMLNEPGPDIVVTTIGGIMQKLVPKSSICDFAELVMIGEEIELDRLIEKLNSGGYMRTAIVEEPGDYCIRGGIVDVFSPMYEDPVRIELFGDTVDSLRFFSPSSQRKTQDLSEAVIIPVTEVILRKDQLEQIIERVVKQARDLEIPTGKVRELKERIKKEGVFSGIESLMPLIYPEPDTFFDYLPHDTVFVLLEPGELKKEAEELKNRAAQFFFDALNEKRLCVEPDTIYMKWSQVQEGLLKKKRLNFQMLSVSRSGGSRLEGPRSGVLRKDASKLDYDNTESILPFVIDVKDNKAVKAELSDLMVKDTPLLPLADWIREKKQSNMVTLIVCSTSTQVERVKSLLEFYELEPKPVDGFPEISKSVKWDKGPVYCCLGQVSSGFVWPCEFLAIITEDEIFGKKRRRHKVARKSTRSEFLMVEDLKKSDLIVHADHGIGRYMGLEKLSHEGITNDYILIIYKDEDRLYLPVDRMNTAKKYIGIEGISPMLDKMGGKSWERVKKNAKKSVEKIAGDLLKLYAARKVNSGYSFSGVDKFFKDFEAGFQYEETPDQLTAIDEVLTDMEDATPMDRLVCGDVGYGKTEVALRASFKAINDCKQVAVLVPTTVLAEQHYKTFTERFEKYPVNIGCLNRFRTPKKQRAIISDLKAGKIDIVIGTHRLLQKDIEFKDIGLIILDEEQRFGVKHKEKLKKIRNTVDVLALTATPIPRTLHMSLMGVRDISVIATPPEERHAIITYISESDDAVIKEAVTREIKRDGQVFFIHNNINTIWKIASRLTKLVPEVRIGVAHGRLKESELEKVMLNFMKREIDMLVCTTIVESGLDIPSANTILVNRADRFGLAQIYQLRGRVGRSDEQAYAYLFIPKESALGSSAKKRLKVLMEHSDLGSGFQIAMSDLQIRGGGSALGVSQSGKIAAVGYDMFLELMERTMSELKGEPVMENLEPEIHVEMSCFMSEDYIPDIDQRLLAYRRLAKMTVLSDIAEFKEELVDRYGTMPVEATNLLLKIMLKVLSIKAGVKRLELKSRNLTLSFSEVHQKHPFGIIDMVTSSPGLYKFTPDSVLKARLPKTGANNALAKTKNILKEIAQHVNC